MAWVKSNAYIASNGTDIPDSGDKILKEAGTYKMTEPIDFKTKSVQARI